MTLRFSFDNDVTGRQGSGVISGLRGNGAILTINASSNHP
jgi:integrase